MMPELFPYLLKMHISLALVYLFYRFVLQKLTFYHWNRWFLVIYSLLSFLIPFIDINYLIQSDHWEKVEMIRYIPVLENYTAFYQSPSTTQAFPLLYLLLIIMVSGIVFMLVRVSIQYISLRKIRNGASLVDATGMKLYYVQKDIIPFSFGNSIYVNPGLHSEVELRDIVHHEFVHVRQKHSIDIVLGEILCVLNWYNPFAWMIRKAIRDNLEFIADHTVLQNGIDRRLYQYLLLKVIGISHFSLASKFNFSSLKKRIAMMNKVKSTRAHLVKFLFFLPLITILLFAFRNKQSGSVDIKEKNPEKNEIPITKITSGTLLSYPDTIPTSGTAKKEYRIYIEKKNKNKIVVVKDNAEKIVDKIDLEKWNANSDHYEKLYGELVPVVVNIETMTATTVSPASISSVPIVAMSKASTTATSVSTSIPVNTVVATVPNQEVSVSALPVIVETKVQMEVDPQNVLVLEINISMRKSDLLELIEKARLSDVTLEFAEIEYNEKDQLVTISGTIKIKKNISSFSATDFEKVILTLARREKSNSYRVIVEIVEKKKAGTLH